MGLSAPLTAPRFPAQGSGYSIVASISAPTTCTSEPPIAANDSYTTAENTTLTVNVPGVLGNDSDPEGDPLTAILVSNPTHGTVTLSPDGSFVYVPTAGFLGTYSFTYEANDGQLNSNVATVTIKVSHVDQPPVAANDGFTTAESTTLKVAAPGEVQSLLGSVRVNGVKPSRARESTSRHEPTAAIGATCILKAPLTRLSVGFNNSQVDRRK